MTDSLQLPELLLRHAAVALALVVSANVAPWAAGRLLGARAALPLDLGATLTDGTRLLGSHKTWRGLLAAVLATAAVAGLLGAGAALGAAFGALAVMGDAVSSLVKRRLRLRPGTEVPALDQLPEALLPLAVLARPLGIGLTGVLAAAAVFMLLDIATARFRRR